jgi:hypothetical protein
VPFRYYLALVVVIITKQVVSWHDTVHDGGRGRRGRHGRGDNSIIQKRAQLGKERHDIITEHQQRNNGMVSNRCIKGIIVIDHEGNTINHNKVSMIKNNSISVQQQKICIIEIIILITITYLRSPFSFISSPSVVLPQTISCSSYQLFLLSVVFVIFATSIICRSSCIKHLGLDVG